MLFLCLTAMGHAAAAAISGTDCVNHYGGLAFWLIRLKMCTQTATRQPVKKPRS